MERFTRHRKTAKLPQWLLLSVTPSEGATAERAMVWVSDKYRSRFLKLFEDYLEHSTKAGLEPKDLDVTEWIRSQVGG